MNVRRSKGTGSIIKLSEGQFRARFTFNRGEPREDIPGSPFPSYADAESALDKIRATLVRDPLGAVRARCGGVYFIQIGDGPIKIGFGEHIDRRVLACPVEGC